VQEQYAEKFSGTPVPDHNAVHTLIEKFHETGSVLDTEQSGRPSKLNDKKLMDISDSMLRSPSNSFHKVAQENISGLQQCIKQSEKNWTSSHTK
jgi:transposase